VRPVDTFRCVLVDEPVHVFVGQEEAVGEQLARTPAGGAVRRRVQQQLEGRCRTAAPGGDQRRDGREVAARAVSADGDAVGICAQVGGFGVREVERGERVL